MKFSCDKPSAEELKRIYQRVENWHNTAEQFRRDHPKLFTWHRWFAWLPVRVNEGDCRWLEWVERKYEFDNLGTSRIYYLCFGTRQWRVHV